MGPVDDKVLVGPPAEMLENIFARNFGGGSDTANQLSPVRDE
jgi:hypothetical protein